MTIQVPRGLQLTGRQLAEFQRERNRIDELRALDPVTNRVAQVTQPIIFRATASLLERGPKTQRSILLIFEPSRLRLYIRPCGSSTKAMIGLVSESVSIVPARRYSPPRSSRRRRP